MTSIKFPQLFRFVTACYVVLLLTYVPEAFSTKRSRQISEYSEQKRHLKSKKMKKKKKGRFSKGDDDYYVHRCFDDCLTTADSSSFLPLLSVPMNYWMNDAKVIYICNGNNIGIANPVNLTNYDYLKTYTLTIACCGGSDCILTYMGTNLAVNGFVINIPPSTYATLKLYGITLNQYNNNVDSGAPSSFFKLPRVAGRVKIRGDYFSLVQYPFSLV